MGLLIFLKQYIIKALAGPVPVPWDETGDSDLDEDDEEDKEKEEKKSLKERLQAIQEVTQGVQNAIGRIASLLEAIKKYGHENQIRYEIKIVYFQHVQLYSSIFILYINHSTNLSFNCFVHNASSISFNVVGHE